MPSEYMLYIQMCVTIRGIALYQLIFRYEYQLMQTTHKFLLRNVFILIIVGKIISTHFSQLQTLCLFVIVTIIFFGTFIAHTCLYKSVLYVFICICTFLFYNNSGHPTFIYCKAKKKKIKLRKINNKIMQILLLSKKRKHKPVEHIKRMCWTYYFVVIAIILDFLFPYNLV